MSADAIASDLSRQTKRPDKVDNHFLEYNDDNDLKLSENPILTQLKSHKTGKESIKKS